MQQLCVIPTSNILNPHWRWCNDAQLPASFMTTALPLVPLYWLHSSSKFENLQSRRTSERVNMMYKIINRLVDVNPTALLEPSNRSSASRRHQAKLQIPHSCTDTYLHSFFPSPIRLWCTCKCIISFTEGVFGAPHIIIK